MVSFTKSEVYYFIKKLNDLRRYILQVLDCIQELYFRMKDIKIDEPEEMFKIIFPNENISKEYARLVLEGETYKSLLKLYERLNPFKNNNPSIPNPTSIINLLKNIEYYIKTFVIFLNNIENFANDNIKCKFYKYYYDIRTTDDDYILLDFDLVCNKYNSNIFLTGYDENPKNKILFKQQILNDKGSIKSTVKINYNNLLKNKKKIKLIISSENNGEILGTYENYIHFTELI